MSEGERRSGRFGVLTVVLILGMAFWLRWTYVQNVSLYVDEYITLRAARQILERGLPLLPTGNFYSHGLLLSYVEAALMALSGFDPLLARLPVLLVGLLAVALTWWLGRRWFSPAVGLLAAALLALSPEAIVWGGRARMYAPLQFFVLLALFFHWRCLTRDAHWRQALLFALSFLCALFLHAETMLLLPALVVIAVGAAWPDMRRGGLSAVLHRWWRTGLLVAWLVAGLGVLLELWFRKLGPPMVSRLGEGIYGPSGRVYVQAAWDWPGIRKTLAPLLTWPPFLGLAVLLAPAWLYALWRQRQDGAPLLPRGWQAPLLHLLAIVTLALPVLLFLADPSWKSPRYLFMLLPIVFMILAAGLLAPLSQAAGQRRWQWGLVAAALAVVVVAGWRPAWAAAHEEVASYDRAFEFVASQWQPGDAVLTFVPQAALFYLGQSDYVSIPTDYRGFAYEEGGRWLEGWDAIPLLDSGRGVSEALAAHERLWFVVDEHRFHSRFAPDLVQAVWDGMELVWREGQVMVFRTASSPPPPAQVERRVDLGPISLLGYALETEPASRQDLALSLYWSADEVPTAAYSGFVHFVDDEGRSWAQDDGPPGGELYPTTAWRPGEVLRDRRLLHLPPDLPAGLYRLEAGLYDPVTRMHLQTADGGDRFVLGFVRLGEPEPQPPDLTPVGALFGGQIRLIGYTLAPAGERDWTLALVWSAEAAIDEDYTVFVHLLDGEGEIRGQHDGPPGGGDYPTSFWLAGDLILDRHELSLPADAPAGIYHLLVGLYRPDTGERLPVDGGDFVELATWTIP